MTMAWFEFLVLFYRPKLFLTKAILLTIMMSQGQLDDSDSKNLHGAAQWDNRPQGFMGVDLRARAVPNSACACTDAFRFRKRQAPHCEETRQLLPRDCQSDDTSSEFVNSTDREPLTFWSPVMESPIVATRDKRWSGRNFACNLKHIMLRGRVSQSDPVDRISHDDPLLDCQGSSTFLCSA